MGSEPGATPGASVIGREAGIAGELGWYREEHSPLWGAIFCGSEGTAVGRTRWYITTPIYYPSDNLHIGHAYTTVAADALARYHRLRGDDVWFVTGTDEHGQKIARLAEAQGLTPKAMVDGIVAGIRELWQVLHISYDDFIRTTEPRHERVVQQIFARLKEQGDIYKGQYEGWYCVPCETFWPESKLVDGRCPDCGRPVERVREESYFLRLSAYQDRLLEHFRRHPEFVQPESRLHEMVSFVEQGLEDLSVSRKGLSWGIPVPGDPDHTVYVWFDALINYLTAAGYPDDTARMDAVWPPDVQLVGKEIVRFHTVIWPVMLMALGLPLPTRVFGHGWLLLGDTKMSKSRGNVVDPRELVNRYGLDAVRYYLLREVPFGADGSYTEDALILRTNVDLANDLGNLLHRTVAMIGRFNDGYVPPYRPGLEAPSLQAEAEAVVAEVEEAMAGLELNRALGAVQRLVRAANKYIEERQPWTLSREPGARMLLDDVLYNLAEALRVVSVLLTPFMIETPSRLRRQLGITTAVAGWAETRWGLMPVGHRVEPGSPLFPRLEVAAESEPSAAATPTPAAPGEHALITLEDFQRLDLRVGTVEACEPVVGTDRLLKLSVNLGNERRTVVSGIAQHYAPEDLVGRQVVLVANLKPAKLRGIVSQGMILAASANGGLAVVGPWAPMPDGSRVK
jgi:methionyl-tRNA synthetase